MDFEEEEEEEDERLGSHEKAETNSRNRRTAVAMTPMSTARNKSPFSSSSSGVADGIGGVSRVATACVRVENRGRFGGCGERIRASGEM